MRLSALERVFLAIPFLGGLFFGLAPFISSPLFAQLTGYSGNDAFIYELAGAPTFGYAVALWYCLGGIAWQKIKPVVIATLVFNIVSLYACACEIFSHTATPVVYLILVASLVIVAITTKILRAHAQDVLPKVTYSTGTIWLLRFGLLASLIFGIFPLFPAEFAAFFGYMGTDTFIYRQAGAATLGYAAMSIWTQRKGNADSLYLVFLMSYVFNSLSFLASVLELIAGRGSLLVLIVGSASLLFSICFFSALKSTTTTAQ